MSNGTTKPGTPPIGATASSILTALASTNGYLSLAIQVGGVVIPLIVGLVKSIKSSLSGAQTIEYTVVVSTTQAELDKIITGVEGDLAAINAELARLGLPPLAVPTS